MSRNRVRFLKPFDYKPTPAVTISYPAGYVGLVKADCAARAVERGCAERIDLPSPPAGLAKAIKAAKRIRPVRRA